MTAIFAISKRLLASNKISFIITALVVLCATSSGDVVLSNGNYTWLLAVMTPFFFGFYDYTKLMHLGANKKDYFLGSLSSYGILAFCISAINTVIHLLIDPAYSEKTVINLMDVCELKTNQDDIRELIEGHSYCNGICIAEAKYQLEMYPLAIYNSDIPVILLNYGGKL